METTEVNSLVCDPFAHDARYSVADMGAMIQSAIASARHRLAERRAEVVALGELSTAPLDRVRGLRKAVEADDKALRDFDGRVRDALLDASGFKAFVVQTRGAGAKLDPASVRGGFAEIVDALKTVEAAAKPEEPKHTYFYAVTATDAEHSAIRRAICKADPNFAWVAPQNDEQDRLAMRLFNCGNEEGGAK